MSDYYPMVLPRRVESQIADERYGKFVISPLERGYGFTLGTSLKKALLSSLPGASVIGVRVNEGLQVYDNIPGVRETVASLVLQVKQIKPIVVGREENLIRLHLDHHGAGDVYAQEILCPPNVRIQNTDLYLFTADDADTHVSIEFVVQLGEGYKSAEQHPELPEGFVPIDAIFSPVERISMDVDSARVKQKTNYDKLIMEIWTDGTLSPQEALSRGAIHLIRYLQVFDPESEDILKNPENFIPPELPNEPDVNPLYDVPIEVLDLSTRVFNSLRRTGITSIGDVIDMLNRGEEAMLAIRNFGQTSLDELKDKLIANGYLSEEE